MNGTKISDEELGRRLAALRAYRRMTAPQVQAAALEMGHERGFGSSMLSTIETARRPKGTDRRSVRILCEIYDFDYDMVVDPATQVIARPTPGIIEQMQGQMTELASVVSDLSAQVQTAVYQRDERLAEDDRSDQQDRPAESQTD